MGAMVTEDSSEHQKVTIWSPLGRHGDRKSQNASGGSPLGGRHGDLPLQVVTSLFKGMVATYGRHGDLDVQVATSSPFAPGRHLLDGEKDGFHGDLLI